MAVDRYGNALDVNEHFPSIVHSPAAPESRERVKWEAQNGPYGYAKRPYVKRDYPTMMYLAGRPESGIGPDTILESELVDEPGSHYDFLHGRGFRETPTDALAAFKAQSQEFARLAANLEYQKQNELSPRAAAEVEAAQDASPTHLPMVPVTPIKARPKKDDA